MSGKKKNRERWRWYSFNGKLQLLRGFAAGLMEEPLCDESLAQALRQFDKAYWDLCYELNRRTKEIDALPKELFK